MKILVTRNDKLGDFMLAWPALAALRASLPDATIHVLISGYTAEVARLCPSIDDMIIDPGVAAGRQAQARLLATIRKNNYQAAITLFSTTRIGWLLMRAGIPVRLAPATKVAQILYPWRLRQRRSRSEQPEYRYNLDLITYFLHRQGLTPSYGTPPWLGFPEAEIASLRLAFCQRHAIPEGHQLLFLHPGSGGSARNLSLTQYAALGRALLAKPERHLVLTAGPGEETIITSLREQLPGYPVTCYHSTAGLAQFARHIAFCDLFLSGSTGPLHVAGALNCRTVGFYPRRRSSTALRWQTINHDDRRLEFSPPASAGEEEMSTIDPELCAAIINHHFHG